MKGITYELSRVHARCHLPCALTHVQNGDVDPEAVVTRVESFEDAAQAISEKAIKMVFTRETPEADRAPWQKD